jgi:glycosyltransferase involved in cell wall biosynthesis
MRILIALTYYRPHYSGLTIYTERLARALAGRGHQVTVLTSRFDPSLPEHETVDGVEIVRLNVLMRLSKGVLMPSMPAWAIRLARQADVINLQIPQLDAAPIALASKLMGKPVVVTYHCDLHLPSGLVHRLANEVSHLANHISARAADRIVTNTRDYAENSAFLRNYMDKVVIIPPPVTLPEVSPTALQDFRERFQIPDDGSPVIGMAARLAAEKGVEVLIQAMPQVLEQFPSARVLFVGQHENVLGEEAYARKLEPLIEKLGKAWSFLGILTPQDLAAFFHACSVVVLPSLNGTESFGMVQVEAMTCGTPVVASNLPGVRQPVRSTGMGCIVPPGDSQALAGAILDILADPSRFRGDALGVAEAYSPVHVAASYETLFEELTAG